MTSKIILLLAFLLSTELFFNITYSQEYKQIDNVIYACNYLYDFQTDSNNTDKRRQEDMYLLIGKEYSQFAHYSQYTKDSLLNKYKNEDSNSAALKTMPFIMQNRSSFFTSYNIIKNHKTKYTNLYETILPGKYQVINKNQFNWKLISNSDTIISNYNCKKANIHFAGRHYYAWFTTEIPISDGPYVFSGLPGLIVKIEDSKKEHIFTLTSFKPINYPKPILLAQNKYQTITYPQYIKTKKAKSEEIMQRFRSNEIKITGNKTVLEIEAKSKSKNNFIEKY
jgi:GLPGLI family protein